MLFDADRTDIYNYNDIRRIVTGLFSFPDKFYSVHCIWNWNWTHLKLCREICSSVIAHWRRAYTHKHNSIVIILVVYAPEKQSTSLSLYYPIGILPMRNLLSQNFDNMLCTINWHWLVSFCIYRTEFSWIFHWRWYTHSCIKRIYINYRCKWCYVHFISIRRLRLLSRTRQSQSVNRFGRQFQPTFWRSFSLVRTHVSFIFICMFTIVCAVVCVCVFSCRLIYVKAHMKRDEMPRLLLPGEKESGRRREKEIDEC